MYSLRVILIVVFSIVITTQESWCQDQKVADSLRPIYLRGGLSPDEKMELLKQLTVNEINDIQKSIVYCDELIELAEKQKNRTYVFDGYYQKAVSLRILGDLKESLRLFFECGNMAATYNLEQRLENSYIAIADVYSEMGNSDNAINYYNKAIAIYKLKNNEIGIASTLLNAGDEFVNIREFDRALKNFEEAALLFQKNDHISGQAYAMGNMGMALAKKGQLDEALINIRQAIDILEKYQDYYAISEYLTYLSDIYLKKNDWKTAAEYSNRSLELAQKHGLKKQISETTLQLSELNEKAGNFDLAYGYLKNHIVYRDSLQNLENIQSMATMRTNFEVSQKQTEVNLLSQQKQNQKLVIFLSLLGLLSIGIVAIGLFRRNNFISKTKKIIEVEKERSEKLLLNILPEETAKELKDQGRVKAKKFDSVSVMFTDFKNFTNHSEHLSPEELVKSVDFYFTKFDEIMDKHGLEKIKTMGDAYMCAAGLPFASNDHAQRMIMAAKDIVDFVEAAKHHNPDYETRFDIRIGISSGPVIAGVVGQKKFVYDIWGDTVNIAARMESNSEPGKINISENTFELLNDEFKCTYRGKIDVKNKGMMRMYYINHEHSIAAIEGNSDPSVKQSASLI